MSKNRGSHLSFNHAVSLWESDLAGLVEIIQEGECVMLHMLSNGQTIKTLNGCFNTSNHPHLIADYIYIEISR